MAVVSNSVIFSPNCQGTISGTIGSDLLTELVYSHVLRRVYLPPHYYLSCVDLMAMFGDDNRKSRKRKTPFNPSRYWSDNKTSLLSRDKELYDSIVKFRWSSVDGKNRQTDFVPGWAAIFLILLMDTPRATQFKKAFAKGSVNYMTAGMLKYRAQNIAQGIEWAADGINQQLLEAGIVDDGSPERITR